MKLFVTVWLIFSWAFAQTFAQRCLNKEMDLTFMLEDSEYLSKEDLVILKAQIKNIITNVWDDSGENKVRFSFVTFGWNHTKVEFPFANSFVDKKTVFRQVDSLYQLRQTGYAFHSLEPALKLVRERIVPLTRGGNVTHIVLIMPTLTRTESVTQLKLLKNSGAVVFVMGLESMRMWIYEVIASQVGYVVSLDNIEDLTPAVANALSVQLCDVTTSTNHMKCPSPSYVDVTFVLQDSIAIDPEYFSNTMKVFVKNVTKSLHEVAMLEPRVSVLQFGTTVQLTWFHASFSVNILTTMEAIDRSVTYRGESDSNSGKALEYVRQKVHTAKRPQGTQHFVIVLTNDISSFPRAVKTEGNNLRNNGLRVYAIGVGEAPNKLLLQIASNKETVVDNIMRVSDSVAFGWMISEKIGCRLVQRSPIVHPQPTESLTTVSEQLETTKKVDQPMDSSTEKMKVEELETTEAVKVMESPEQGRLLDTTEGVKVMESTERVKILDTTEAVKVIESTSEMFKSKDTTKKIQVYERLYNEEQLQHQMKEMDPLPTAENPGNAPQLNESAAQLKGTSNDSANGKSPLSTFSIFFFLFIAFLSNQGHK